jgi:large subunit ribosomal protein L9
MEVILKQDVANLGYKDDIVKVRDGYGRNYLIPNHLAIVANQANRKILAEDQRQRAHKLEKIIKDMQTLGAAAAQVELVFTMKASKEGKLYGSVTTKEIAERLVAEGVQVDRKQIALKDPAKEVGEYKAILKLHKEVNVELPFRVVAEEENA